MVVVAGAAAFGRSGRSGSGLDYARSAPAVTAAPTVTAATAAPATPTLAAWTPRTPGAGRWVPDSDPYSYTPSTPVLVAPRASPGNNELVTNTRSREGIPIYTVSR